MQARLVESIGEIAAADWDALSGGDNPFVTHAFLSSLESHGCIAAYSGWYPRHLALYQGERLVGAVPMYLKSHSYGEFVFDFAWSRLHESHGLDYYPKLLVAVPLTPVVGPRLLASDDEIRAALAGMLIGLTENNEFSSVHVNFVTDADAGALRAAGFLERHDWQYHWRNRGYRDFDDFLDRFTSKQRKNIRRERRALARQGWEFERIGGREAGEWHWLFMHGLYKNTFERKGNWPLLTQGVFREWGRSLSDRITLVLARRGDKCLAGAFLMESGDTLYGRYWGRHQDSPGLHFETCYYQGLEHAIARSLARFDPGAQGSHKITRGFEPVRTTSFHYLRDSEMRRRIGQELAAEQTRIAAEGELLRARLPFHQERP